MKDASFNKLMQQSENMKKRNFIDLIETFDGFVECHKAFLRKVLGKQYDMQMNFHLSLNIINIFIVNILIINRFFADIS